MMTLTRPAAEVYTATGARDWDAEDAAHMAWVAGYETRVREQARWYGLALAGMDRLHNNRRTVSAIARDFARWLAALGSFDRDAAAGLRREVADLMHWRDEHPEPVRVAPDPTSDPDGAFEMGYHCGMGGRPGTMAPIGYDCLERRAFNLGVRAAAVDMEGEGGTR